MTHEGSTMAHAIMQDGRVGRRHGEKGLAKDAKGRGPRVTPWALAVTGLALALAFPAFARSQQSATRPWSPSGGTLAAAQPAAGGQAQAEPPGEAPAPRVADQFLEAHPRLSGLPAGTKPPIGFTPIPTKEEEQQRRKYDVRMIDPKYTIDLVMGQPRLWYLSEVPFRIQVADEAIANYTIIGDTPRELSLLGRRVGITVINLWFGDRSDLSKQTVLSYRVNVLPDPEAKERLERMYRALEDEINRAFPDAQVCLFLVGDKVVLTGQVKDAIEATKILQIVRSNVRQGQGAGQRGGQARASQLPLNAITPLGLPVLDSEDPQAGLSLEDYIVRSETNVINMLRIPGEQQVMMKVVVAEVSRAAARSIGLNWSISNDQGITVFAQNTGGTAGGSSAARGAGAVAANLPVVLDRGEIPIAIEALRTVDLARSIAEPNLVTLNGRPATFFAGGEFPVPVVAGTVGVGLSGVSFVPFGVHLFFTPLVSDKDRIRLQLNATVSTRDVAIGASIGTGNTGNTFVPGLNSRTISTTVEMREGQTLAIGGLLQMNLGGDTTRVPFFGDIPFGGQLFRHDKTSMSESELVLLVTPELVHPMEPKEVPPLPGSDYFEPGDLEFYLHGQLESYRSYDYRSPVMHDIHRMCAYRHCELLYFAGPHGHSEEPGDGHGGAH
jgi:pilus assembly protein CpaC